MDRLEAEEFPGLVFTGDPRLTKELDEQTDHPTWVRMAWDALLALQDYAEAAATGTSGGDFRSWCENTPRTATRSPAQGDPRGVAYGQYQQQVEAGAPAAGATGGGPLRPCLHGRPPADRRRGHGPRLHYHDDCSGTGKVYIGYIGLHLHNTRTN
ncbi:hypothetical protein ACFQZC_17990 [Streptacidiphilus monticola]